MKELFAGRHFDREIIVLCVRGYLRYKLSLRNPVEMMAEHGVDIAHTTIMRWVQRYVPEFEKRWNGYARKSGRSWHVDETYLKVRGLWVYRYRAVDWDGNTVDFRLSPKRDVAAAKAFFRKALSTQLRAPVSITLQGYAASHGAVREIPNEDEAWKRTKLRSSKYMNNLIEQDHRGIKSRTRPVLGFKNFDYAAITIAGVELLHRIRKVNLPCIAYVSKTKLRLRSGMHSWLHKPLPLQSPQPAYLNICTRARSWTIHSKRHTGSSVCSLPVFHERADRRLGSLPDVGSD